MLGYHIYFPVGSIPLGSVDPGTNKLSNRRLSFVKPITRITAKVQILARACGKIAVTPPPLSRGQSD